MPGNKSMSVNELFALLLAFIKHGQLKIEYKELADGAEITYSTDYPNRRYCFLRPSMSRI